MRLLIEHYVEHSGWGMGFDLAYGGFVRSRLDGSDQTPGNQPPQPTLWDRARIIDSDNPAISLVQAFRRERIPPNATFRPGMEGAEEPVGQMIYLFNVMVALEWLPNTRDLQQLEWAFRSASDFLYDVTDGYMAFGQVMVVGREFLNNADIAIMASNRLQGRAWREGLHKPEKNLPIRLGRGNWRGRSRISIPWDEPEGYRTIIHEWGHYALNLFDSYLKKVDIAPKQGNPERLFKFDQHDATFDAASRRAAVMPTLAKIENSIMVTLEGTSELAFRPNEPNDVTRDTEWTKLRETYRGLPSNRPENAGPVRLPLPLPLFVWDPAIDPSQNATPPPTVPQAFSEEILKPIGAPPVRCWMYTMRPAGTGVKRRLVAQGTLDDRAALSASALLGAGDGDELVVICERPKHREQACMLASRLPLATDERELAEQFLEPQLPATPLVAVIPVRESDPAAPGLEPHLPTVVVRVYDGDGGDGGYQRVALFPSGEDERSLSMPRVGKLWQSDPEELATLDGHVLLDYRDEIGAARTVATFSQGGGPDSGTPHEPPTPPPDGANVPITAGSSDGAVLLFFGERPQGDTTDYRRVKVVTTALHGTPARETLPGIQRSQVFCVAANARLPLGLDPTLVIVYEPPDDENQRTSDVLTIYRLDPSASAPAWKPLPTYVPSDIAAVVPLAYEPDGPLVSDDVSDDERVEFFVVCSQAPAEQTTPAPSAGLATSIDPS
jgi:hypothetical protein